MKGNVGKCPVGLPLNCIPQTAPPILFDVQSSQQIFHFGGYPYHCIYSSTLKHARFVLKQVKENVSHINSFIDSSAPGDDDSEMIFFHPDNSNRIILKENGIVRCFQLDYSLNESKLQEIFSMSFSSVITQSKSTEFSSFGRRITKAKDTYLTNEKCVLAVDYDDELDVIGILGFRSNDPLSLGFIKLYDSMLGQEVKCIELGSNLCEYNCYSLNIDLDVLIVIEKNEKNWFNVYLYKLMFLNDRD